MTGLATRPGKPAGPSPGISRGVYLSAGLVLMATLACAGLWLAGTSESPAPREMLREANELYRLGDLERAQDLAVRAMSSDSSRGEAAVLAADCAAARGDLAQSVRFLLQVRPEDGAVFENAAWRAAQTLHYKLFRLREAEQAYLAVLRRQPDDVRANEQLARLLSLCGRRDEAIPCVLRLIRSAVETDLVILLARESGGVVDRELLSKASAADPTDPNPMIGEAWIAISEDRTEDAIIALQSAVSTADCPPVAWGLLGKQLAAVGRWTELQTLIESLPESADDLPDVWLARAMLAEHANNQGGAVRCWWEVLKRRPESRQAASQLTRLLAAIGRSVDAAECAKWSRRLQDLSTDQHKALFSDGQRGYGDLVALVHSCESVGRLWESLAWGRVAVQMEPDDVQITELLDRIRRESDRLPLAITSPESAPAARIDVSDLSVPGATSDFERGTTATNETQPARFSFQDDAAAAGLYFRYFNGTAGPAVHRMYEFSGGGIAVLDLDRDDCPDVFLTQGTPWPPAERAVISSAADSAGGPDPEPRKQDTVFRNRRGLTYDDATANCGIVEAGFGQGASTGDLNNDGFPDLYVANIGRNAVWVNNGDGTFSAGELRDEPASDFWTTSCAVADLNGDALPDLYDVNYVMDSDVFERVCRGPNGQPVLCAPNDFQSAPDQIWLSRGDGSFSRGNDELRMPQSDGNGLGIIVWAENAGLRDEVVPNDAARHALSVFVANDQSANGLLRPIVQSGRIELHEVALSAGVAFNGRGEAEACMGVAADDVDGDGRVDLMVTNFWHETNTLYVSAPDGIYADRTQAAELADPSRNVLGFGTQFLDADRDGGLELFVTNGHLEDLQQEEQPFRMAPQLFTSHQGVFRPASMDTVPGYFSGVHVGRAVARCDWNLDCRDDLIVGHLTTPVALLSNVTEPAGGCLSLRLCGNRMARDAIGTTVRIVLKGQTREVQLTAGDGYQASNERRLNIGCGPHETVEQIEIRWPGGRILRAEGVSLAGRYAADENAGRLFLLSE